MSASAVTAVDDASPNQQDGRYVGLLNLLACGQVAFFLTTSLWVGPFAFPQVPLLEAMRSWPNWLDFAAFLGSLAGTCFARRPQCRPMRRIRHAICAVSLACLFGFNQHRLQPWAYQLFVLHAWLSLASVDRMLFGWRWLTISIYGFSALSKFDYAFCLNHGPFLWDGFLHVFGWNEATAHWHPRLRFAAAAAMPIAELSVAACLALRPAQRVGLVGSLLMHVFLIAALGPWGHDHSAGVLLWNGFFIVQNWLLFPGPLLSAGRSHPPSQNAGVMNVAASVILAIALFAPLGEPIGLWDHWPGWAVYAARPEKIAVMIHEDDLQRLPDDMRRHLQPPAPLEPWHPLRLDRWSLEATKTPIYPQARFHVGVALWIAERHHLATLKIIIDGPPNRWTGRRDRKEFAGLDAVRDVAAGYRCNALPR